MRFSLLLRYTSKQAYKLLLEEFPLPSLSLLKKLSQGGIEPLKALKVLLDEDKIGKDIVVLIDEMYLQKEAQYQGGNIVGINSERKFYKGIDETLLIFT